MKNILKRKAMSDAVNKICVDCGSVKNKFILYIFAILSVATKSAKILKTGTLTTTVWKKKNIVQ